MFRTILIGASLAFLFACSSGSSGNKGGTAEGPQKPDPGPTGAQYRLGGVVSGLQGELVLSNGIDDKFAIVLADGPFMFPASIPSGELYNVRIEAKPADHICEVANSRSFLVKDTADIIVRCAKAVERVVSFVRPSNIPLNRMILSSNYQRIGAGTQQTLQEQNNRIQVFDNSFVSLSVVSDTGVVEPIYVAHVNDMAEYLAAPEAQRQPLVLNADSTARALVLLEPSLATALLERLEARPRIGNLNALLTDIFSALDDTPEYQALKDKVHALVVARKTLSNHDDELQQPTYALTRKIAALLVEDPTLSLPSPNFRESVQSSGVSLSMKTEPPESQFIEATNQSARHVSVRSPAFDTFILKGFDTGISSSFPHISPQSSLAVYFHGPGGFGQVTPAHRNDFVNAVVHSGMDEQFFPAMNLMLGLQNPLTFKLRDCFDASRVQSYTNALRSSVVADLGVADFDYSPVYNTMFHLARQQLTTSNNTSLLNDVFTCDKFGVGTYLQDKIQIAKLQVGELMVVAQKLYAPPNNDLALFAQPGLTFLSASIAATNVETSWTYSNNLVIRLLANRSSALPEQSVDFQAECLDPAQDSAAVACEIEWDYGDGFKKAPQLYESGVSRETHRYTAAGNYTVTATAVRTEGAQVTQSLDISVQPPEAKIEIRKPDGTVALADQVIYDFGQVQIGVMSVANLQVRNTGNIALAVESLAVDDNHFNVEPSSLEIPVGQTRNIQLSFNPTSAEDYLTKLTVLSNAANPENQILQFALKGAGFLQGKPATGGWTVVRDGMGQDFVVQRAVLRSSIDQGLAVRIFGEVGQEFPQILLNVPGYKPGQNGTYSLDDVGAVGCNASIVLDGPENSFCTNTSPLVSMPLTGTVEVTTGSAGTVTLRYEFTAGLNVVSCGTTDVAQCETVSVDGTAVVSMQ